MILIKEKDLLVIIDCCSCKEEFIKRKIDDHLNNKTRNQPNDNIQYYDYNNWKVVDKGGKYKKGISVIKLIF